MICPNCNTGIKIDRKNYSTFINDQDENGKERFGYQVSGDFCPECNEIILFLTKGKFKYYEDDFTAGDWFLNRTIEDKVIYPNKIITRSVPSEIPENYKIDFVQAWQILNISPKASAALSRRILQQILSEEFEINKYNLVQQIEEFINLPGVPSYLSNSIDAIRNIGNFAAHPLKSTSSGDVVDVEVGEAEWTIEVIEALFDFTFVQPKRLQERREQLNKKLVELGKPEMK
ncbi:DUF4145 domain-containing protein [Paenibacillus lautus]|uniref:DUF4145 domain-containing protein n=1 Tax=Paenibacillus lautus TaxID=1401 RepID=UPI003D2BD74F